MAGLTKHIANVPTITYVACLILWVQVLKLGFIWWPGVWIYPADWAIRTAWIAALFAHPDVRSWLLESLRSAARISWLWLTVVFVVIVFAGDQLGRLVLQLLGPDSALNIFDWPKYGDHESIRLLDLTFGLFLVAVSEEFLFTVVLVRHFESQKSSTVRVYAAPTLIFVAVHWSTGLLTWNNALFNSVVSIWLFRETRSIIPVILIHWLFDIYIFSTFY